MIRTGASRKDGQARVGDSRPQVVITEAGIADHFILSRAPRTISATGHGIFSITRDSRAGA